MDCLPVFTEGSTRKENWVFKGSSCSNADIKTIKVNVRSCEQENGKP